MKLFAVVTILSLLATSFGQPVLPNPDMTIKSQGTGTSQVPLTTARITVRVEQTSDLALDAQANVSMTANTLIQFLLSSNVSQTDIRTESINVRPLYRFENGEQFLIGYRATYIFSFDVPVGMAGSFLDRIVEMGGNIDSIEFLGSPEDITQAQNDALSLATEDARRKATTVLSSLGLCPDGVKSINVEHVQAPQTANVDGRLMLAAVTPVLPGTGDVTANVNIEWMFIECASMVNGTSNDMGMGNLIPETGTTPPTSQ